MPDNNKIISKGISDAKPWTNEGLSQYDKLGAFSAKFGNTNFGKESYDTDDIRSEYIQDPVKLEQIRGERQGFGAEVANAIGGGLAKLPFTVIGNTASMLDFEDYFNTDKEIGNAVTKWAEEIKGNIEDATKIYKSNDNTLSSREWWMNNAKGLIDSAGAFAVTGMGLGAGVNALSSLAKGSQLMQKIIQGSGMVTNAVMLNQAESIPIAMNVYQQAIESGKSEEEAADAAAYSIAINRLNIPLNLTSAGAFLRSPALTRQVAKDYSKKEVIANLLAEGTQEYVEENINMIAEKEALRKAQLGKEYTYDFNRTVEDVLSKEGFETGLVGFIGGAFQTGLTDLAKSFQKDSPSYDEDGNIKFNEDGTPVLVSPIQSQKERYKAQQKSIANLELLGQSEGVSTIKETLNRIKSVADLTNDIQEATLNGDDYKVAELKNELLVNQSLDAFKNGTTDRLINLYKSITKDPTSKDKYGDDYITKAQEAIKQIETLEQVYINHKSLPQVNEVVANKARTLFNINQYEALGKSLQDAQLDQRRELEVTGFTKIKDIESLASTKEIKALEAKREELRLKTQDLVKDYENLLSKEYTQKATEAKAEEVNKTKEAEEQVFEQQAPDITEAQPVDINEPVVTPVQSEQAPSIEDLMGSTEQGISEDEPINEVQTVEPTTVKKDIKEVEIAETSEAPQPTVVNSESRQIFPGLNNKDRAKHGLPNGDSIRETIAQYEKQGIDINTKISVRPYFIKGGNTPGALITLQIADGSWVDIGSINAFANDTLNKTTIDYLHSLGKAVNPKEAGIFFSMSNGVLDIISKEDAQPSLSEIDERFAKTQGEYLVYDRTANSWDNPYFNDDTLEVKPDIEDLHNYATKNLNNTRYVLLVRNGNKYDYVRLRATEKSKEELDSIFSSLKDASVKFKDSSEDLTAVNEFNSNIDGSLFIALNPDLKVDDKPTDKQDLKLKIGKYGRLQAELNYKLNGNYDSITEYFTITNVESIEDLIGAINKQFKDKRNTDLNLKLADFQNRITVSNPDTIRAAVSPKIFKGSQLVFDKLNVEEQPAIVQVANKVDLEEQINTPEEPSDEDDINLDIMYSTKGDGMLLTDAEIESVKKLLPSFITIEDINTIINNLNVNGIPYGAFRRNLIYLNRLQATKGTAYHEAFHAVFRTVLNDTEISKYLKAAKNEFKGDIKKEIAKLLELNPAYAKLTNTQLEELVLEEYMADKFADYAVNKSDKSIGATLKQFFKKIIDLFKGLFNNTDESMVLFDKILSGSFVNSDSQINRFNGNNTVFKLLPKSYDKTNGLRYFTSNESRLLINTLTSNVHKAILNGDTREPSIIFDSIAKDRYDELENDGRAYIDKLMSEGNIERAVQIGFKIDNEQFVLSPEEIKGQAYNLLKSEVLNRLALFSYIDKQSEISEEADETQVDTDDKEIKESFGSKDAWLTGGHDSLSKTIKGYIAFTTYTKVDELTGKVKEFGVDEVTLYNGLIRILTDTSEDAMFDKLALVAESNDNVKAFLNRITKEMNITYDEESGTYNTSNINPEAYNTFRLFVSNFKKSKAEQIMITYNAKNIEDYKVFNANTNDPKAISRDQWYNALYYIVSNNKLTNKQLAEAVDSAYKTLIEGNDPKKIEYLTEDTLNDKATRLKDNLAKVGITISKSYAKYSVVKAKEQSVNEANAGKTDGIIPLNSTMSEKSLRYISLYNVKPITKEVLKGGNQGYNLYNSFMSMTSWDNNPYQGDKDINTRLEELAEANSYFDETIGNSSFTNAEGNRVYEIINLSYVLAKTNDFKSDAYWDKIRNAQGATEIESKNFKFITDNYLLNNHYDSLKDLKINIINGFRNESDTEGITYGSFDKRTYFASALAMFNKTTKNSLARYIFRQNEASSTAYVATAPKINALNDKGGLTSQVKDAFYNKFVSEFNRITREFNDFNNPNKLVIKGYNDSLEKGKAYRFAEFSYLAFINPELFNNLTRMAQEGNLDELKANEVKVKSSIENYLLQEGYTRFKEELETIGFLSDSQNFIPKGLVTTYGSIDNALKQFYINDYLMSSSINELLDGDYALSRATKGFVKKTINGIEVQVPKNAYGIDISKRNKGGMASGPDYGKGEHTVAYIKDINNYIVTKAVDGTLIRVTQEGDVFKDAQGNTYTKDEVKDITTNDAQSYASQYHHIFGSMRLGRLDKRSMDIYKGLIQFTKRDENGNIVRNTSINEADQEYLENSLASSNSKKTITFDGIAGIYHKLSEAGLWRSSISYIADEDVDAFIEYTNAITDLLYKDKTEDKLFRDLVSELADLYKPIPGMEYLHNLANKMDKGAIDQVVTESASKGATIKPVDSFDGDLTKASTKVKNNAKRLQTETPTGKDVITAGSQLINLIDTELNDDYEIPGFGTLGEIRNRYRQLMADSRSNSFKQAMTYIKIAKDGSTDITKLREKLVRALEANNADESVITLFDKGYNLNLAAIIDKSEQIVLAHFSKGVLNQKVNGTKVSLMSDAGIEVVRDSNDNVIGIHEVLRNPEKYKTNNIIKDGVSELFNENPELASLGSKEQYSQYLDTIFPNSKIKDIVYRSGAMNPEEFSESMTDYMDLGTGYYLSPSKSIAKNYGIPKTVLVNIKNPKDANIAYKERVEYAQSGNYDIPRLDSNGKYDGIVDLSKDFKDTYELVVFEPEQMRILGSKQDIEGFKNFLNSNKNSYTTSKLKYNVNGKDGRRFSECMLSERILTKHGLKIGDNLPQELFEAIGYRIPTQGHQSMMALKVVGLLPNYYEGVGIFPQEIVYLSGADFDIDSEFIQLPQFWMKGGEAIVYGTEKTNEDKWLGFKYYNLNYNKEFKIAYKKEIKAGANSKDAYIKVSKDFNLPSTQDEYNSNPVLSNGTLNNESLKLMIGMLTNDYVQDNSANSGTTTDPMADVSNEINKLLDIGVSNSNKKVPDDYLSSSDINGKSISNAKNSAGKSGIGIVANKVQQLTLLFKANGGKGITLRDGAFRWSIGGKQSKGYLTTVDNTRVMDIMGVLLNVMTDNAKDPIAGNMNLSLELLNGYTEFLAQGADKYEAALVLNQPSVQLYGQLKKVPNYTLVNAEESNLTRSNILKAALAKIVTGKMDKDTVSNIGNIIKSQYGIDISNPESTDLNVSMMEGVLKKDPEVINNKDYVTLQINALLQFNQLENQANDISNLNTYLTLNQGLDISFAELRHNLEKADDKLNPEKNPSIHVNVLPLIEDDKLTSSNINKAKEVLDAGAKVFIEQSEPFRNVLKTLDYSINSSYLNTKGNAKKISRDFLSYLSTTMFKQHLENIVTTETNETKRKAAQDKLATLKNYSLVYPQLDDNTIAKQLTDLKNHADKDIRNNSLVKYLKPSFAANNGKGIDFIDGKSFAKESAETISTLIDGFRQLFMDPNTKQFAINLFNYSLIKDNLQFKFGSIMKYLDPGMFHTYSEVLTNLQDSLNTNKNVPNFDILGYNFRKLFATYVNNEKDVLKYKSFGNEVFITASKDKSNIVFNASIIRDSEPDLTKFENIFEPFMVNGKQAGYTFPQFYNFNGNVYELKVVDNNPHNQNLGLGVGNIASYTMLQRHGNESVSPYSFENYESAIATDDKVNSIKLVKPEVKQSKVSEPDVIENTEENLVDSSEMSNFGFIKTVDEYNADDYIPTELPEEMRKTLKDDIDDIMDNNPDIDDNIKPC